MAIAVAIAVAARVFSMLANVAVTGFALVKFGALAAVNVVTTVALQDSALAISTCKTGSGWIRPEISVRSTMLYRAIPKTGSAALL